MTSPQTMPSLSTARSCLFLTLRSLLSPLRRGFQRQLAHSECWTIPHSRLYHNAICSRHSNLQCSDVLPLFHRGSVSLSRSGASTPPADAVWTVIFLLACLHRTWASRSEQIGLAS